MELSTSMEQKVEDNMTISCIIGYGMQEAERQYKNPDDKDFMWYLIDCGYARQYGIMEGRCSLTKSLEFSMEEWEKEIDNHAKVIVTCVKENDLLLLIDSKQEGMEAFNRLTVR